MVTVSGDVAHLTQCGMLRASPNATGHCCWVSIRKVSPWRLSWSLMLLCLPIAYKTQLLANHLRRKTIVVFPMELQNVTEMILTKNFQYSI